MQAAPHKAPPWIGSECRAAEVSGPSLGACAPGAPGARAAASACGVRLAGRWVGATGRSRIAQGLQGRTPSRRNLKVQLVGQGLVQLGVGASIL